MVGNAANTHNNEAHGMKLFFFFPALMLEWALRNGLYIVGNTIQPLIITVLNQSRGKADKFLVYVPLTE